MHIKSEVNTLLKWKLLMYVPRAKVIEMGRRLIQCKWVFEIKQGIGSTLRYRTRLCIKEFHLEQGVDFTS